MRLTRYFYSLTQKTIERFHKKDSGISIYMFHQVNDKKAEWKDPGVCITESAFKGFIEALEKKSYNFISVDELSAETTYESGKKIALTFDDIFQDAYRNAFPILNKKRIPYCVFITENYVDKPGYITSDELKELAQQPLCTIGYHTKNHKLMRDLRPEEIQDEIDCRHFENKIGRSVQVFAFPYGSVYACSRKSIQMANAYGYLLVFSTIRASCTQKWIKKRFRFIPRINVCENNFRRILENT